MENSISTRAAAIALAGALATGLGGAISLAAPSTAHAKGSGSPAKVKVKSVKVSKAGKMTVRVAKAKHAKKYRYKVWGAGLATKTYKTKRRTLTVAVKKARRTVKVKVQAYNGQLSGKWSRTVVRSVPKAKKKAPAAQEASAGAPAKAAGGSKTASGTRTEPSKPAKPAKSGGEDAGDAANDKLQYSYKVRFVHQPTSKEGTGVFVDTDNPDSSFTVMLYDKDGNQLGSSDSLSSYRDGSYLDYTPNELSYTSTDNTVIQWDKVGDKEYSGLTGAFGIAAGKTAYVQIWEWHDNGIARKNIGKVKVRDSNALYGKWQDAVISASGANDSSLSKSERMDRIVSWLGSHSRYYDNIDGKVYPNQFFTNEGLVAWDFYRQGLDLPVDSYSSPGILVDFGEKIGYPLENCYGKYERGSAEWYQYHYLAYSKADDKYYGFCPDISTGAIDPANVKQFDPDTYTGWYDVQPL